MQKTRIDSASLCNSLNSKGFFLANKRCVLDRLDFINNYTQEVIDACWEALSVNVIQNYQRGKGTSIKGFGTFTFKNSELNLEGTTNENIRDKKPKSPVFIVSKEFNENFKAGEYTKQNGIRYYTQKESKNVSIVKLNLAEIAYSLSMSKEEVAHLLKHLIFHLGQSIVNKTFKNKILPGLGVLVNRNNIIAVNFNESLVNENKLKNQILTFTKKNIFLSQGSRPSGGWASRVLFGAAAAGFWRPPPMGAAFRLRRSDASRLSPLRRSTYATGKRPTGAVTARSRGSANRVPRRRGRRGF